MRTIALYCACALLGLGGCTSDEPTGLSDFPLPELPDTPDAFMQSFERAYALMDQTAYEILLDEDFDYKFLEVGRDAEPWSRELEIASTGNMFDGNPAAYFDGHLVCTGVESIAIQELIRLTPWEDIPPSDPDFPGTERAMYQVNIIFHADDRDNTLTIASRQIFYVRGEEVERDGGTVTEYRLCGQRDLRPDKANENLYWGDIKRMFLPE